MDRRRDSCSRVHSEGDHDERLVHHVSDRPRPQPRCRMHAFGAQDAVCVAIGVFANRCHFVAWPAPHRFSRGPGRELAVVKELMPDFGLQPSADIVQWPSMVVFLKKQKRMLGDVADGVRSLLARLGSDLVLAERELWSRQLRWHDEFRDSLLAHDTMTLDGRRWRYKLPFLLKCLKVARFLPQCSNFGTVAEQVLRAILPSSCTSVTLKSLQTKDRPRRSTIQRHQLSLHVAFVGCGRVTPYE